MSNQRTPARRRLNIGHKHGGKIVDIVAIAHDTYKSRAYWHFRARVEWNDGSHLKASIDLWDVAPYMLCWPDDQDRRDLDKAMHALNEYLASAGTYEAHSWVPHEPKGERAVSL